MRAKAQATALKSIDEKMKTKSGMLAAQFLLGQRYIDAFQKQAKKENTFITKLEMSSVANNINEVLNMIPQKKE